MDEKHNVAFCELAVGQYAQYFTIKNKKVLWLQHKQFLLITFGYNFINNCWTTNQNMPMSFLRKKAY